LYLIPAIYTIVLKIATSKAPMKLKWPVGTAVFILYNLATFGESNTTNAPPIPVQLVSIQFYEDFEFQKPVKDINYEVNALNAVAQEKLKGYGIDVNPKELVIEKLAQHDMQLVELNGNYQVQIRSAMRGCGFLWLDREIYVDVTIKGKEGRESFFIKKRIAISLFSIFTDANSRNFKKFIFKAASEFAEKLEIAIQDLKTPTQ